MMRPGRDAAIAAALVAAALLLRGPGVSDPPGSVGDEEIHVPAAVDYVERSLATDWFHPQLAAVTLWLSMAVLGDEALGWRARNVVLGAITVALVYLLALRLLGDRRQALAAALLILLDPLHVLYSRTTFHEIQVACLFVAAVIFLVEWRRGARWALLPAGVFLGLAGATKAYFAPATGVLVVAELVRAWRARDHVFGFSRVAAGLVAIPAAVYLAVYLPWFRRGYDLWDFLSMQAELVTTHRGLELEGFQNAAILAAGGRPWQWFVAPIAFGFRLPAPEGVLRVFLQTNHFPFTLLALAGLAHCAVLSLRRRDPAALLLLACAGVTYAALLAALRPIFLYSLVVLLPFTSIAAARALWRAGQRVPWLPAAVLALFAASAAYLYPLATGRPVPEGAYRAYLGTATIFGAGGPPPPAGAP